MGSFTTIDTLFTIKYSSNESDVGFENSIMIQSPDSRNRTNISVPANFTGQQVQVQVTLSLIGRESASAPFIVGKSYYVAACICTVISVYLIPDTKHMYTCMHMT